MELAELWLGDFRSYEELHLELDPGVTAILGDNGEGKSNIVEAIAYLATLQSFRGSPTEAMVRQGATSAVVRARGQRDGRELLIEAELRPGGRGRVQVNKQRLARAHDLLGALRVSVFAPDDLVLVKGGPAERRRYLDDTLVAAHTRHDLLRTDVDKILRQRNALLKQSGGRLSAEVATTLDVWDTKLVEAGTALARERVGLLDRLGPLLAAAYDRVANRPAHVEARYESVWWGEGLEAALLATREQDLRRGVSLVGPHRDDMSLSVGGLPARTQASQGEQRSLALAMRLAAHEVVTEAADSAPVLLLDDVFSELDPDRCDALLASLPRGQTVLTSASGLPPRAAPDQVLRIDGGRVVRT